MNQQELQQLGQDIKAGLRASEQARNLKVVERPKILDEQPIDTEEWRTRRAAQESTYLEALLSKRSLDKNEQEFVHARLKEALQTPA
jgi:hypothetical protein